MNDLVPALILRMQEQMREMPQIPLETQHIFAGGLYCRVLPRPAGTLIIGKKHLKEHLYMVIKGRVSVTNGEDTPIEICAPAVIVSKVGTKRAVLALEDSICLTVHRTDETDLEKVEEDLVEPEANDLYLPGNVLKRLT